MDLLLLVVVVYPLWQLVLLVLCTVLTLRAQAHRLSWLGNNESDQTAPFSMALLHVVYLLTLRWLVHL